MGVFVRLLRVPGLGWFNEKPKGTSPSLRTPTREDQTWGLSVANFSPFPSASSTRTSETSGVCFAQPSPRLFYLSVVLGHLPFALQI